MIRHLKNEFIYKRSLYFKLKKLVHFYISAFFLVNFFFNKHSLNINHWLGYFFQISQPRRQRHFNLLNSTTSTHRALSTFYLLNTVVKRAKFFKRHRFNILPTIVILRYYFKKFFDQFLYLICLNFNYSTYTFLIKLRYFIKINFSFALLVRGYTYLSGYRRRIKRRILRSIQNI